MSDKYAIQVQNNYQNLKRFVLNITNVNVETVKRCFKISKRRLDFITNMAILIKILEKLGELDAFHIHPIEIISENVYDVTSKKDLQSLIKTHKTLISKCNGTKFPVNLYAQDVLIEKEDNCRPTPNRVQNNSCNSENARSNVPNRAFEEVFECISVEIGRRWKDLARSLEIEEEEIEDIDCDVKLIHTRDKMRKCLNILLKKKNPDEAKTIILEALTKSRRNDIRKKAESMFK